MSDGKGLNQIEIGGEPAWRYGDGKAFVFDPSDPASEAEAKRLALRAVVMLDGRF